MWSLTDSVSRTFDPRAFYAVCSLIRLQYGQYDLTGISNWPWGSDGQGSAVIDPVTNRRKVVFLPLPDCLLITCTGLEDEEWIHVITTSLSVVNLGSPFGGWVTRPVADWYGGQAAPVAAYINNYGHTDRPLIFAGHSFGGAMAVMHATAAKAIFPNRVVLAWTFGTPKFSGDMFNARSVIGSRIENASDQVPALPPNLSPQPWRGVGWTVNVSGLNYADGEQVYSTRYGWNNGRSLRLLERAPLAQPQAGTTNYQGSPVDSVLNETSRDAAVDHHGIAEYVRRLRRFFGFSDTDAIDAINNRLNPAEGQPWRIPLPVEIQTPIATTPSRPTPAIDLPTPIERPSVLPQPIPVLPSPTGAARPVGPADWRPSKRAPVVCCVRR